MVLVLGAGHWEPGQAGLQWLTGERLRIHFFLLLPPFTDDLEQALSPFLGGHFLEAC